MNNIIDHKNDSWFRRVCRDYGWDFLYRCTICSRWWGPKSDQHCTAYCGGTARRIARIEFDQLPPLVEPLARVVYKDVDTESDTLIALNKLRKNVCFLYRIKKMSMREISRQLHMTGDEVAYTLKRFDYSR